ncbi:MAG: hypothetical protein ABIS86_13450 [Streptosporangiaceae bacterium]
MSDETKDAKPATEPTGTGVSRPTDAEPDSSAPAQAGQEGPVPGGQDAAPGPVPPYQVPPRTPTRVMFGRVIRNSAVQLAGAGLIGGLVGGGVVAIAAHDGGPDRRPGFSRQLQQSQQDQRSQQSQQERPGRPGQRGGGGFGVAPG